MPDQCNKLREQASAETDGLTPANSNRPTLVALIGGEWITFWFRDGIYKDTPLGSTNVYMFGSLEALNRFEWWHIQGPTE